MINALADFGDENGLSFYGGAGIGYAWAKALNDSDSAFAWQLIAGLRYAISPNIDLGLKYRFFRTGNLHFDGGPVAFAGTTRPVLVGPAPGSTVLVTTNATLFPEIDDKFASHSLLASLIFNFGGAEPPPPPPPPPPEPERG